MSATSEWAQGSIAIAPADLARFERAAAHQQRLARRLQAAYLLILLAAPLSRLVPLPWGDDTRIDERTAAVLLLAAVGMRLLVRRIAADADWVRARRESEDLLAVAWRRCMAGCADPEDGPVGRRISTVAVAAVSLAVAVPGTVIGLVSVLLATSEAWLQFRRSDVLASSFAEAREELVTLREQQPVTEGALVAAVDAVELVLERERWTWTAIMSITVLTSSGKRPAHAPAGSGAR
jgi:hypothetical protein